MPNFSCFIILGMIHGLQHKSQFDRKNNDGFEEAEEKNDYRGTGENTNNNPTNVVEEGGAHALENENTCII